jgi:hypothetical protein
VCERMGPPDSIATFDRLGLHLGVGPSDRGSKVGQGLCEVVPLAAVE